MKRLITICFAIAALLFTVSPTAAQSKAPSLDDSTTQQFSITPYVPESVSGLSANNRNLLTSRLNAMLSRMGVLSQIGESRFILTATLATIDKEVTATAPAQVVCKYEVTMSIGDGMDGTLYASAILKVKGVGQSEDRAVATALKQLSPDNDAVKQMVRKACDRIIEYYNRVGESLMARADALCVDGNYDEAIYLISTIPMGCNHYEKAMQKLASIYQKYADFNCTLLLTDAKAAWAANPTTENAAEVVKKLSGISPNASNYKQVSAFIKEVESATKAEIKEEREAERTEATRSYELQKQQISAARDVAIAYAAQQTTGMKYKTLR